MEPALAIGIATVAATIAAAYIAAHQGAAAVALRAMQRELDGKLVAIFYKLGEMRCCQMRRLQPGGGWQEWHEYDGHRAQLGQMLRELAVIAGGLPESARAIAMRQYHALTQVSNHTIPRAKFDALEPLHDALVCSYPDLLEHLRHEDGAHDDFHRLTDEPRTPEVPSVADRKRLHAARLERADAAE